VASLDAPDPFAWRSELPWSRSHNTAADNLLACELGGSAATSVARRALPCPTVTLGHEAPACGGAVTYATRPC
jgi:hypothetical protein